MHVRYLTLKVVDASRLFVSVGHLCELQDCCDVRTIVGLQLHLTGFGAEVDLAVWHAEPALQHVGDIAIRVIEVQ